MYKYTLKNRYTSPLLVLWRGETHMHICFWLCWFVPIYTLAIIGHQLPGWITYLAFIYLLVATIGTWRSTRHPPGQLWVPGLYRIFLMLFVLCCIIFVGMILAFSLDVTF
jgi:hypothetical protein